MVVDVASADQGREGSRKLPAGRLREDHRDEAMHALCVPAGTIYDDGSDEADSAAPTQL